MDALGDNDKGAEVELARDGQKVYRGSTSLEKVESSGKNINEEWLPNMYLSLLGRAQPGAECSCHQTQDHNPHGGLENHCSYSSSVHLEFPLQPKKN